MPKLTSQFPKNVCPFSIVLCEWENSLQEGMVCLLNPQMSSLCQWREEFCLLPTTRYCCIRRRREEGVWRYRTRVRKGERERKNNSPAILFGHSMALRSQCDARACHCFKFKKGLYKHRSVSFPSLTLSLSGMVCVVGGWTHHRAM